ncbi:MAG: serine protease, partial [Candidatus Cloacimonetes bacterium]|nr:serine protease [Candidatus Cloacimonadota bacterium]
FSIYIRDSFIFLFCFLQLICLSLTSQETNSTGTGFFINDDGYIVTCSHVIDNANTIKIKYGKNEYVAQVIAKDNVKDLAILKINQKNVFHFSILDFPNVDLGDKVYVLGFPLTELLGTDIRLTDGVVSARSGIGSDQNYFQISAPIQPGNSGGPIFNQDYRLIGVAAVKLSDISTLIATGQLPQNINFGIKAEHIKLLSSNIYFKSGNIKSFREAEAATVQIICYEANNTTSTPIKIYNNTGYTIYYVYISPSSSDQWGSDLLATKVILDERVFTATIPNYSALTLYDVRVIDSDNDSYTKRNIRLNINQTVEFTILDLDIESSYPLSASSDRNIRIINSTGYAAKSVYISPSDMTIWKTDILEGNLLRDGHFIDITLPVTIKETEFYDIRLIDTDNDTYTLWNVSVSRNRSIEFLMSDLDRK